MDFVRCFVAQLPQRGQPVRQPQVRDRGADRVYALAKGQVHAPSRVSAGSAHPDGSRHECACVPSDEYFSIVLFQVYATFINDSISLVPQPKLQRTRSRRRNTKKRKSCYLALISIGRTVFLQQFCHRFIFRGSAFLVPPVRPRIPLAKCVESWATTESIDGFFSTAINDTCRAEKSVFPPFHVVLSMVFLSYAQVCILLQKNSTFLLPRLSHGSTEEVHYQRRLDAEKTR